MTKEYIAHVKPSGEKQSVEEHLNEVGQISSLLAEKIGVPDAGRIIGLLHDFGKYSEDFQNYIGSATGLINADESAFVDFDGLKGKIDHSTAGAQWIWEYCQKWGKHGQLVGQILAICIASHHSGMIDCLNLEGENTFIKRMQKSDEKSYKKECIDNANPQYLKSIENLVGEDLIKSVVRQLQKLLQNPNFSHSPTIQSFNMGFWTRFLFSCLIDADRIDSADFECPDNKEQRNMKPVDWSVPVNRLECFMNDFKICKPIDKLRHDISSACKERAKDPKGVYTLTVPTGGGKTYTSLRFALHHAQKHKLDRIIYIIPYTSIIEQNADSLRKAIEAEDDKRPWILENHSNLEPVQQTWHSKLVSENWDAPVIMTTMVQFLETLFSGGTRSVRRMHQLANAVLIFDEIQTLPINCIHLFSNAINFLTQYCKTTAILCTATQPLLNKLKSPEQGQLILSKNSELIPDVPDLFNNLKRVEIKNNVRPDGWTKEEIAKLAIDEFKEKTSCLIIVNTKIWAQELFHGLKSQVDTNALFHLSTNLCPEHRKKILSKVRKRLERNLPVLCISTQLIEAGVDVDFSSVIRFLAGLDSIAQAAGRCNRNGLIKKGIVYIVNPIEEKIDLLKDIKIGRDKAQRVLDENFNDILSPQAMDQYFKYYFYDRAIEMSYPLPREVMKGINDNLLNLLSNNPNNIGASKMTNSHLLKQSFMLAGKVFKSIDTPSHAIIVQYNDESRGLVAELGRVAKEFDVKRYRKLLKQAQKYSVNVFPNIWQRLLDDNAVHEIQPGEAIYYLDEQYYSDDFGLSDKPCSAMTNAIF